MARPIRELTEKTKEALYLAAVKEQRNYHHKQMEQSFRRMLAVMPEKQKRRPRIRYAMGTLGWLPPSRPPELPYLMDAILEAENRGDGLYAICRFCEEKLLPHLITKKPMTARSLMDRARKARRKQ